MENAPPALVERAKQLILTPRAEWPVIDAEPATIADMTSRCPGRKELRPKRARAASKSSCVGFIGTRASRALRD